MLRIYSDKLVLKDSLDKGYIDIEGNVIKSIVLGEKPEGEYLDLTGKYILPGLINIHSVDYAKELGSKYNMYFSEEKIFYQIEKLYAELGVTTVFHTFTLDKFSKDKDIFQIIEKLNYIKNYRNRKFLIDHKVHLKFKLGDININKKLKYLVEAECVDFLTCTGYLSDIDEQYQQQYISQYLQVRFDIDDEKTAQIAERIKVLKEESALDELSYRLKHAKARKIPFATSKYELVQKLKETYKINIDILVDPTTPKAIDFVDENDLASVVDIECLTADTRHIDFMDEMSEDNISILSAATRTKDILEYVFNIEGTIGLPKAVRLATYNPAQALGMLEKGELAPGKEADLIVVEMFDGLPINTMTISDGKIIVKYNYNY